MFEAAGGRKDEHVDPSMSAMLFFWSCSPLFPSDERLPELWAVVSAESEQELFMVSTGVSPFLLAVVGGGGSGDCCCCCWFVFGFSYMIASACSRLQLVFVALAMVAWPAPSLSFLPLRPVFGAFGCNDLLY